MKQTNMLVIGVVVIILFVAGAMILANKSKSKMMTDNTKVTNNDTSKGVMVGGTLMTPDKDIVDNAVGSKDHTTLVAAVKAAGLVDTLKGTGPFTVFAPTNAAFDKLPAGTVDMLVKPENKDKLTKILTYHVVPGRYTSADLKDGMTLKTVEGDELTFTMKNGKWMINDSATVEIPDVISSNGVTFVIDTVLMPSENGAMMKKDPSKGVMVGGALMTPDKDIVANAMNASNVTTVVAAVKAAGLVETLQGPGPFTVFAPNNAAFDKLPAGTVDTLLKPENKAKLASILTYHVVAGRYTAANLTDGMMLKTVNGQTIKISKVNGKIMVNDAAVETNDVISSNGVTFVIDSVLMPQQ